IKRDGKHCFGHPFGRTKANDERIVIVVHHLDRARQALAHLDESGLRSVTNFRRVPGHEFGQVFFGRFLTQRHRISRIAAASSASSALTRMATPRVKLRAGDCRPESSRRIMDSMPAASSAVLAIFASSSVAYVPTTRSSDRSGSTGVSTGIK